MSEEFTPLYATHKDLDSLRGEFKEDMAGLRSEMATGFSNMAARQEATNNKLTKRNETNWAVIAAFATVLVAVAVPTIAGSWVIVNNQFLGVDKNLAQIVKRVDGNDEETRYRLDKQMDYTKDILREREKVQQEIIKRIDQRIDFAEEKQSLEIARVEALNKVLKEDINLMKTNRFTDKDGEILRNELKSLQQTEAAKIGDFEKRLSRLEGAESANKILESKLKVTPADVLQELRGQRNNKE